MSAPVKGMKLVNEVAEALWEARRREYMNTPPPWGDVPEATEMQFRGYAEAALSAPPVAAAFEAQAKLADRTLERERNQALRHVEALLSVVDRGELAAANARRFFGEMKYDRWAYPLPGEGMWRGGDVVSEPSQADLNILRAAMPVDHVSAERDEAQAKLEAERAEVDRLREALFGLLVFARGNPVVLAKIHGALDGRVEDGGEL